jgi:RNA polymerase sigma factor (sigma-70 family)
VNGSATAVRSNPGEFEARLTEHRGIVFKIANSYCPGGEERDDLVQEICLQLWRSYPGYDAERRFSTWMYRVALNVAISFQRRESTRRQHLVPEGEEMLEVAGAQASEPDEEVARLYRAIARLDDLNKALVLLYLDGHSHAEISEVVGITATNVGTRIGRLKERLKDDVRKADQR